MMHWIIAPVILPALVRWLLMPKRNSLVEKPVSPDSPLQAEV